MNQAELVGDAIDAPAEQNRAEQKWGLRAVTFPPVLVPHMQQERKQGNSDTAQSHFRRFIGQSGPAGLMRLDLRRCLCQIDRAGSEHFNIRAISFLSRRPKRFETILQDERAVFDFACGHVERFDWCVEETEDAFV